MLRIGLLGGFRLASDGTPLTSFNTPRLQAQLAYLILHRENPQPRQLLAFVLWPDPAEAQTRTNLRNLIHLLLLAS
jgi:DNA-binding SARP family transcriptional activator